MPEAKIVAVDVFCGAAGLSCGLQKAGIAIAAGIDVDPDCSFPFEANTGAPFLRKDVSYLRHDEVASLFPRDSIRLLAGCAPCQPFSSYTAKRPPSDDKWRLLVDFARLVQGVKPDILTLENVPRLIYTPLWAEFVNAMKEEGYRVAWGILDASRYGVPQARRRLVLLGSRLGDISLPRPSVTQPLTVRSAIGMLPSLSAGQKSKVDVLHRARSLTDKNLARIRVSRPASTWRDWPEKLRVRCHVEGESRYPSVYGRMSWDKPSPTITTQFYGFGNGRFGHPEQDRAISLREGALLQSFPLNYNLVEDGSAISFNRLGKLIGNAVPPALAFAIARALLDHVECHSR